jgi:hypothetical protein
MFVLSLVLGKLGIDVVAGAYIIHRQVAESPEIEISRQFACSLERYVLADSYVLWALEYIEGDIDLTLYPFSFKHGPCS